MTTECYFAAPRVLGILRLYNGTLVTGRLTADLSWEMSGYLSSGDPGPDPTVSWLSIAWRLGTLSILARPGLVSGWFSANKIIRNLRAKAKNEGRPWAALGLPCPRLDGYTYSADTGLSRVVMTSGAVRQRRRWADGYRTVNTVFEVRYDQLFVLEEFIKSQGYDWFNLDLITGTGDGSPTEHLVRIKSDPAFSNVYGNNIEVALTLEVQT